MIKTIALDADKEGKITSIVNDMFANACLQNMQIFNDFRLQAEITQSRANQRIVYKMFKNYTGT